MGYTTPFLARGLADTQAEHERDRQILSGQLEDAGRQGVLLPALAERDYRPRLHAIDDFSNEHSRAPQTLALLKRFGLQSLVDVHQGDFRGSSPALGLTRPLDLVWFDAGGPREYLEFLREYWPLISEEHGLLILHFTYWQVQVFDGRQRRKTVLPSPLLNELKRQQFAAGTGASFEVFSLLEPHKYRQGSVTLIRKLPPRSRQRARPFAEEMRQITGNPWPAAPELH
jgi:hypothetical protein